MSVALHHRVAPQPNMRKVIVWSFVLHIVVLIALSLSFSHRVKLSTPAIQVKLIGVPQPAAAAKKEPQKVRTQDSAAPKEPPKEAKNIPPSDATTKFVTEQKPLEPEKKINPIEAKERPPTLDKSPKEKKIVKNDLDAKVVKNPEDFLESIDDFLKDSKPSTKPTPQAKPVENKPAGEGQQLQLNLSDQGVSDAIGAAVSKNWFFQGYDVKGLSVEVQVQLSADGQLIGLSVVRSSGNTSFDQSLVRAIRKTDPLPIPADKLAGYREFNMIFDGSSLQR